MRNFIQLNFSALINRGVLFLILMIGPLSIVCAQSPEEQEILDTFSHKKTVVYKSINGVELDMIIFYPEPAKVKKENPWMLHVHGGGWAGGSKYKVLRKSFLGTLRNLLDNGVVCATIEYRKARGTTTAYDAVVDAKDAARFLLENADEYKLDKNKYGIWGGSAGGHLSLVTALSKESDFKGDPKLSKYTLDFKCVASYFPFTSCINPDIRPNSIFEDKKLFVRLLGAPLEDKAELAKLLSPTELLEKKSPPILLLHGDKDTTLPIINSTYMMEVAKEKNADVELLTIKNAGHSFSGANISPSIQELNDYATKFILSHLK
ncbi:prolyl oligopeptidase family serine peptidase [Aureibaculum sp. A20]|uniref:Prolyl oligopeptidase family serine peptidase n=1 Tax=Aureibaculum flavum TaxID=2795986 RepID=A0ABS0WVT0_9FLAO|nr:prolyl oligopeptidase family serine peptidase [Aureibaculum flavum]MBJ2175953.1 prolyl oligopeptidase family serine peptidase [Aureibaculum flavum]